MRVRRLPCSTGNLIENSRLSHDVRLFNPSKAGKWLYLRMSSTKDETSNILLHNEETGRSLQILSPMELLENTMNIYKGLEDLRLFEYEDKLWFACTCTHLTKNMTNELGIGYFNEEGGGVGALQYVDIGIKHVKNITPFVRDGMILLLDIYTCIIHRLLCRDDRFYVERYVFLEQIPTNKYKGSTSPVHLHGALYGCVVHDNIRVDQLNTLSYLHYWIEFNIDIGIITFISAPFIVVSWGIEFISGIEKKEDCICLFMSVNDKVPLKVKTTLSNLRAGRL